MRTQIIDKSVVVSSVQGNVQIQLADGSSRPLQPGEILQPGAKLNIADDAQLVLAPYNDRPDATPTTPAETPATDATAQQPSPTGTSPAGTGQNVSPDIAALQQSILQGTDPTQNFEASAAGGAPAAGGGGIGGVAGASGNGGFVTIERTGDATIATAGFDTDHAQPLFVNQVEDSLPLENELADGDETITTIEGEAITGNVLDNTFNPDGPSAAVVRTYTWGPNQNVSAGQSVTQPGVGTLVINSDGSFTFTPEPHYDGPVPPVTYVVDDGRDQVTSTLTITITPVNDVPTVSVDPGNPQGANDLVYESGLPGGSKSMGSNSTVAEGGFKLGDADGLGDLKSVTINGTTIPIANLVGATIPGDHGTLTITSYNPSTGQGTYSYTLTSPTTDVEGAAETDVFTLTVSDGKANSAPASITIEIVDDLPHAVNDSNTLAEGNFEPVTGNVITGGAEGAGADTKGADGAVVSGVVSNQVPGGTVTDEGGNFVLAGEHGSLTLNPDGSYSYVRHTGTPGGVDDVFTYTLQDGDGDTSTATLTIHIGDSTPTVEIPDPNPKPDPEPNPDPNPNPDPDVSNNGTRVYESGLPEGSSAGDGGNKTDGVITFTSKDGLKSVSLGEDEHGNPLSVPDATNDATKVKVLITEDTTGKLEAYYEYDAATGEGKIYYSYTLLDNTSGDNTQVSFPVVITDMDDDTSSGDLVIKIVDDVPTAKADVASVDEGSTVTGNVVTGVGIGSMADIFGADGANASAVVGVKTGDDTSTSASGSVGTALTGTYGVLTLNADGSYSYKSTANAISADAVDTFTYTIKDGDGDLSTTTLKINVANQTVTGGVGSESDTSVLEAALSFGSNPTSNEEVATGTLTGMGGAGGYTFTAGTFTGAYGTLVINTDGSYTYTLTSAPDVNPGNNGNNVQASESFSFQVTDTDGNSGNGTLVIDIVDDVPTAKADVASVDEGSTVTGNVVTGVGIGSMADIFGADGANASAVVGVKTGDDTSTSASGSVGTALTGTYGVLTLNADGSYSYKSTANAISADAVDTFTYTIKDGDGDLSTTTLKINVANQTAEVTTNVAGPDSTVNEAGLPGGSIAGDSETDTGSFQVTATDGITKVTIGGQEFTLAQLKVFSESSPSLGINTGEGTLKVTGYTSPDGDKSATITYTYTLNGPQTHTQPGNDTLTDTVSVTVTGLGGNTGSGTLKIDIIDDTPSANPVGSSGQVVRHSDTNLMIILDISGSMGPGYASGVEGMTRLDIAKNALLELFEQYEALGAVKVTLVTFNASSSINKVWVDIAEAKTAVLGLSANGNTNYDAALINAITAFGQTGTSGGKLTGSDVQNVAYFLSDGLPNTPSGDAGISSDNGTATDWPTLYNDTSGNNNNASEEQTWINFLKANQIQSYALGMGTGVTASALNPIAYDGRVGGGNTNAIEVTDMGQLTQTLVSLAQASPLLGNLTDNSGGYGADGGYVRSLTIGSTTYTYNKATGTVTGGGTLTGNDLSISLGNGSSLVVNMLTGKYTYTPPSAITTAVILNIGFTLSDNDGDMASSTLSITVNPDSQPAVIRDDLVLTNVNAQSGQDIIDIPRWALLANDTGRDGLLISSVSGASSGSAALNGDNVRFTENSSSNNNVTDGGSFNYAASLDGVSIGNANVVVTRSAGSNLLTGTFRDEILLGRDNASDTLNGAAGNDILIGLGGDDSLIGGAGNDILVGGAGGDTLDGGSGADTFIIAAVAGISSDSARVNVSGNGNDRGQDTISGFDFTEDTIRIVATNVANFTHGTHTAIGTGGSGTDGSGVDSYTTSTGLINLDGNGSFADPGDVVLTFTSTTGTFNEANFESRLQYELYGNSSNNVITGGALNDYLDGGAGNDTLNGGAGNDTLIGGLGNDSLSGGAGNDLLIGGKGSDTMTGGNGHDIFKWLAGDADTTGTIDTITDFTAGSGANADVLDLSELLNGEHANTASLDHYLTFARSSATTMTLTIDTNGATTTGGMTQTVEFTGMSGLPTEHTTSLQIIQYLLEQGNLKVDP
ncbi:retention module-containing protein [Aeromonas sp. QDB17]|uniref:retention module-containing protein n=1 Tax=Aeromonas sp. QDB17 TaxID=2990485 RepID=UPI0022E4E337|nr:retention module-containing protein [Aeromonas sp. QDB17]